MNTRNAPDWFNKFLCKRSGHKYQQITWPTRAYPMVECTRCHKVGWLTTITKEEKA